MTLVKRLRRLWEISGNDRFSARDELVHAPLSDKGDGKAVLLDDQTEEEAEKYLKDNEGGWKKMKARMSEIFNH